MEKGLDTKVQDTVVSEEKTKIQFDPEYEIEDEHFDSMRCRCACAPSPGPYCGPYCS